MIENNSKKRKSENNSHINSLRCASVDERNNNDVRLSKTLEKECLDLKFLVKNSVEKLNILFNNEQFNKNKTASKKIFNSNTNRININRYNLNKDNHSEEEDEDKKKNIKSNTLNNFINIPNKKKNENMNKESFNEEDEYINNNDLYEELKNLNSNKIKSDNYNNKNESCTINENDDDILMNTSLSNLESNKLYSNKSHTLYLKNIDISGNSQKNKKIKNTFTTNYLKAETPKNLNFLRYKKNDILNYAQKDSNNNGKNKLNKNEIKTRNNKINKPKVMLDKTIPEETNKLSYTQKLKHLNNSLPKETISVAKKISNNLFINIDMTINPENYYLNRYKNKKRKKEGNKLVSSIDNKINNGKKKPYINNKKFNIGFEPSYKKNFFNRKMYNNNKYNEISTNKMDSKQMPQKIKVQDFMRMMLMLNEYLINNNLFEDYSNSENKKILDNYSLFLTNNININCVPKNEEISDDKKIYASIIIQRSWRKSIIEKYFINNFIEENEELRKMLLNDIIQKHQYKNIKIIDNFNNFINNIKLEYNDIEEIDNSFYNIQKLIQKKLTIYEKNLLYKKYINNIIYNNR